MAEKEPESANPAENSGSAHPKKRLILVPLLKRGNGGGHLLRCLRLSREICARGHVAQLYVPPLIRHARRWGPEHALGGIPGLGELEPGLVTSQLVAADWDVVVVDKKKTTKKELAALRDAKMVVALDEGGSARLWADYVLDTLPLPKKQALPNLFSPALLPLPQNRREFPSAFDKVLLTFGGEDPEGLALMLANYLVDQELFRPDQITVVWGPFATVSPLPPGVKLLHYPKELKEKLFLYDLVFTSFGITCFEALYAGVPVILFNPSRYHRKLTRLMGLPEIGVRRIKGEVLKRVLNRKRLLIDTSRRLAPRKKQELSEFLLSLPLSSLSGCPFCDTELNPSLGRFPLRSYFQCRGCAAVYMKSFEEPGNPYNEAYFFDGYAKQYGKSYLEDFPAIKAASAKRLKIIGSLARGGDLTSLLDVGCAYGPFLESAREAGFSPLGVDVAVKAVEYVNTVLDIPALAIRFEELDLLKNFEMDSVDIVTMWYVIEHFAYLKPLLVKVNRFLARGGIFAFSTPHARGISALKNFKAFLQNSPQDHYTLWSPRFARKILKRFGFRVKRIRITGHHPERFPLPLWVRQTVFLRILKGLSKLLGLGDTFEVYAIKEKEI